MVKGVRLSQEELLHQFPLSRRLALRVVALLGHQLEFSSIVLEEAVKGSPLEKLFLSTPFLEEAKKQNWEGLARLLKESDTGDSLALFAREDSRVVALSEEIMAAETEEELGLSTDQESLLPVLDGPNSAIQLSRMEADQLFSPEKISTLKLELLTSSNPNLRIESLRKITFSQIPQEEKERIFLSVLYDKEVEVRQEAVQAMISLGMDPSLASPLRKLIGDDPKGVSEGATLLLRSSLEKVTPFSRIALVAVSLRSLELFSEMEIKLALLELLGQVGSLNFLGGPSLLNVLKALLAQNKPGNFQLLERIRRAVVILVSGARELVVPFLRSQIHLAERGFGRILLLRIALDIDPETFAPEFKVLILQEELEDFLTKKVPLFLFEDFLAHYFEDSLARLVSKIHEEDGTAKLQALQLIEGLFFTVNPPKQEWKKLYEEVIKALPKASLSLVSWALKSRALAHSSVPQGLREKFARELLYHLKEGMFLEFRRTIMDLIFSLGQASLDPLVVFLADRSVGDSLRKEGADCLARLVLTLSTSQRGSRKRFEKVLKVLLRIHQEKTKTPKGAIAKTLGQIAQSPLARPEEVEEIYQTLVEQAGKAPHTFEMLQGLSHFVGTAHLTSLQQEQLARIFLLLLGRHITGHTANVKIQTGEIIFEEDIHARLHTDLMPFILEALKNLCIKSEGRLKMLIQKTLLIKWKRVSAFEEVWSPFNAQHLVRNLEKIARHPSTPQEMKEEITREFLIFFQEQEDLSLASSLADIFFDSPATENMEEAVEDYANLILEMAKQIELHQETEVSLPEIYSSLSKIVARDYFKSKKNRPLQDSVVQLIIKGLRQGHEGVREAIALILRHTKNRELRESLEGLL